MASKRVDRTQSKKTPKYSTRKVRRCQVTGRARAVYRKFRVSRIVLRELALEGKVPGMRKASW
jgi:small subunit ribosomal protein S14